MIQSYYYIKQWISHLTLNEFEQLLNVIFSLNQMWAISFLIFSHSIFCPEIYWRIYVYNILESLFCKKFLALT